MKIITFLHWKFLNISAPPTTTFLQPWLQNSHPKMSTVFPMPYRKKMRLTTFFSNTQEEFVNFFRYPQTFFPPSTLTSSRTLGCRIWKKERNHNVWATRQVRVEDFYGTQKCECLLPSIPTQLSSPHPLHPSHDEEMMNLRKKRV